MEQELFYYKTEKSLLVAKHELDEIEIGDYEQITEEEYNELRVSRQNRGNSEHIQNEIDEKRSRIVELKGLLSSTDYQAIKYAEGLISKTEYAPIKAQRQAYRDEINQLEQEIEDAQ